MGETYLEGYVATGEDDLYLRIIFRKKDVKKIKDCIKKCGSKVDLAFSIAKLKDNSVVVLDVNKKSYGKINE